jgi:hypothetical protein
VLEDLVIDSDLIVGSYLSILNGIVETLYLTTYRYETKVLYNGNSTSATDLFTVNGMEDYGQGLARIKVFLAKATSDSVSQHRYLESLAAWHRRDTTYLFNVATGWYNSQSVGTAPSAPTLAWSSGSSEPSTLEITNNESSCNMLVVCELFDKSNVVTWEF